MRRLYPNLQPCVKCRRASLPNKVCWSVFLFCGPGLMTKRLLHVWLMYLRKNVSCSTTGTLFRLATNSKECLFYWCKRWWPNTSLAFKYKNQVPDGKTRCHKNSNSSANNFWMEIAFLCCPYEHGPLDTKNSMGSILDLSLFWEWFVKWGISF